MSLPRVAFIAVVNLFCGFAWAQDHKVLSLDEAFARALEKHPGLARFVHLREGAQAQLDAESQGPPLRLEFDLENAPRSGQDSAFDTAEASLSLASVIERGGKREARRAIAESGGELLTLQEEQQRADLLAEVARRYLDVVAMQRLTDLEVADVGQRERAVTAATQRVRAGATPDSVRLAAEAAHVRAVMRHDRARARARAAMLSLVALWKSRAPDFERVSGDPLALRPVPSLDDLRNLIERSPELRAFANQARLQEARVQLARSASATDIEWRAGVRWLEEDGTWAAVAGVSIPLGSSSRAAPATRAAQAELAALSLARETESLTLETTLIDAHLRLSSAAAEVAAARDVLLPKLDQAEQSAGRAFRAGALTYTEWAQVQGDAIDARREQLLAAIEANRALIEIQRLTGSPFVAAGSPGTQP